MPARTSAKEAKGKSRWVAFIQETKVKSFTFRFIHQHPLWRYRIIHNGLTLNEIITSKFTAQLPCFVLVNNMCLRHVCQSEHSTR